MKLARVLFVLAVLAGGGVAILRALDRGGRGMADARTRYDLPLRFVPTDGGPEARVRFLAHGSHHALFFEPDRVVFSFLDVARARGVAFALTLLGADPSVRMEGRRPSRARTSHFAGFDRPSAHVGAPTFAEVVYRGAWPGIDIVFREEAGRLKWDFIVAPGADPTAIRLAWRGVDGVELDEGGRLRIATAAGIFEEPAPVSHQELVGQRITVASRFVVKQDEIGFELGEYDPLRPLVIDPALAYATFLGGSGADMAHAVAVGPGGQIYVAGETTSPDFPGELGVYPMKSGATDAFIARLDPSAADDDSLVYATFLGGEGPDQATAIAVDEAGCAYITGTTQSTDFPLTANALDDELEGGVEGFVAKLDPSGTALLYSSYLGGALDDLPFGIAVRTVRGAHELYLAGATNSPDFPGALRPPDGRATDAFVTKLTLGSSHAARLDWSTLLGGAGDDGAAAVQVDAGGRAFVVGETVSADFPVTASNAFDASYNGGLDAFAAQLDSDGSCCRYATFLGGEGSDQALAVALDRAGQAYVTGRAGAGFPTSAGAFSGAHRGDDDAFVARIDPSAVGASSLVYATLIGGAGSERGRGIAVAPASGIAIVVGETTSPSFPLTAGAVDGTLDGQDAWLVALHPSGDSLLYGTLLGGASNDSAVAVALDPRQVDNVAIAGGGQTGFPVTPSAFQTSYIAGTDAVVASLALAPQLCLGSVARDLNRITPPLLSSFQNLFAFELSGAQKLVENGNRSLASLALRGMRSQVALLVSRQIVPAASAAELELTIARCLRTLDRE